MIVAAEDDEEEESLRFEAKATLGAHLYLVSAPFDSSNVSGFFDQWRYIRNQGGRPPYFVDLFHANLGLRRSDDTWLLRLERWSPNALNERGFFDLDWKGLEVEGEWRRYQGDYLRAFPEGTGETQFGGICCFGSIYNPDVPNAAIFDADNRFWIRRQDVGGEVSLRPEGFDWEVPFLDQIDLFGDYETRSGYRQDSMCLACTPSPSPTAIDGFQGRRRKLDQKITTGGGGLVFQPVPKWTTALRANFQSFREDAPLQTAELLPGREVALDFVPDTDRVAGRLDFSRRWGAASLQGGATLTHLSQVGRKTPGQQAASLGDNDRTSYSLWSSFDWPLTERFDVTGFAKWFHLHNGIDVNQLGPGVTPPAAQDSPYIRDLGRLGANVEFGFRPRSGVRAAFGYRAAYSHRKLRFATDGVPKSLALVGPNSLHHVFYLAGHLRSRALRLEGELGYDWGPETAYPNELSKAVYADARASYTFPVAVPLTLSVSGGVRSGKAPGWSLSATTERSKEYQRLNWRYNVSLAAVPVGDLSVFAHYTQHHDGQDWNHLRIQLPRSSGAVSNDLFIDSDQRYESDVYSLAVGGRHPIGSAVSVGAAVSLTWTRADLSRNSSTGAVLDAANRLDNRIVGFETDIEYRLTKAVTLGWGYRLQDFDDTHPDGFLDTSETVHTFTVEVEVDFASFYE